MHSLERKAAVAACANFWLPASPPPRPPPLRHPPLPPCSGNFGTVFVDQAYWMGAIASKPSASYKGYILGGLMWFSIPFTLATSLGLASVALDLPLTKTEAGAGLVPPAVAVHILGKSGAVWITIMLFSEWQCLPACLAFLPACPPAFPPPLPPPALLVHLQHTQHTC